MKFSLFQQLRSYFYPLLVRRDSSSLNPVLDLYYYRGRWQLATADALYSDGVYYRPLVAAFKQLRLFLPGVKRVLVLGTGLGSAVQILHKKGFHPAYTLVELDEKVLSMALALMPPAANQSITPICDNARFFLKKHPLRYDLLIVDVFTGREVPKFVLSPDFIAQCKAHLNPNGKMVLNYMINTPADKLKAKAALEAAFGETKELSFGINRVYIATA